MPTLKHQPTATDENITFFNGFLKYPQQVGSIIPSSRFLKKRLIEVANMASAQTIIELGPGTGGTTRAFLEAMPQNARLLAVEINPEFISLLKRIGDPRLIVHHGSAFDLADIMTSYQLAPAEVIVSGIPFSTMPMPMGETIIDAVAKVLATGGRFVAYQFRDRVENLGRQVFGPARVEFELLNIPPIHVYCWQK